jgi:drug/metabolite transporter (DMT)-like permease
MYKLLLIVVILTDLIVDLVDRRTTRGSDPYTVTLWAGIIQSLLMFPLIGLVGSISTWQLVSTALVAAVVSYGRLQWYSAISAHADDLSRLAPFRRLSSVFVFVFAVTLLNESISAAKATGASLMLGGALLASMDQPADSLKALLHNNRAAKLVIVFAFSSACVSVFYKHLLTFGVPILTCYFYMRLFQFACLLLAGAHRGDMTIAYAEIANVRVFVLCRVLQTISSLLYLFVIKHLPLSTAQPLAAMSPFFLLAAERVMWGRQGRRNESRDLTLGAMSQRGAVVRIGGLLASVVGMVLLELDSE